MTPALLVENVACTYSHACTASSQVYSPEVLRAFGQALINLLRNLAWYLRAMEATRAQHDTTQWLPRLIFLLLQNPLNGQRSVLGLFQGTAVGRPSLS